MSEEASGSNFLTWKEYLVSHNDLTQRITVLETQYNTLKWLLGSNLLVSTGGVLAIIFLLLRGH